MFFSVETPDVQVVISDIDGTITRSDVRGMILPMIGELLGTSQVLLD